MYHPFRSIYTQQFLISLNKKLNQSAANTFRNIVFEESSGSFIERCNQDKIISGTVSNRAAHTVITKRPAPQPSASSYSTTKLIVVPLDFSAISLGPSGRAFRRGLCTLDLSKTLDSGRESRTDESKETGGQTACIYTRWCEREPRVSALACSIVERLGNSRRVPNSVFLASRRVHSFRQSDPPMNRRYLKDTP